MENNSGYLIYVTTLDSCENMSSQKGKGKVLQSHNVISLLKSLFLLILLSTRNIVTQHIFLHTHTHTHTEKLYPQVGDLKTVEWLEINYYRKIFIIVLMNF